VSLGLTGTLSWDSWRLGSSHPLNPDPSSGLPEPVQCSAGLVRQAGVLLRYFVAVLQQPEVRPVLVRLEEVMQLLLLSWTQLGEQRTVMQPQLAQSIVGLEIVLASQARHVRAVWVGMLGPN
jgi:hypothetical protein